MTANHLAKAVATLLTRIANREPADALAHALMLAHEPGEPWAATIEACEATLTEQFGVWARAIDDAAACERALSLAEAWHGARPDNDPAAETVNTLHKRVACLS